MKEYQYVVVITGKVNGKNRSNAYLQLAMGLSLNVRLQQTEHDIAIEVKEVSENEDPEIDAVDEKIAPFDLPVAPDEVKEDGSDKR